MGPVPGRLIDGRVSRLHFEYRIEAPTGVRTLSETHVLGLFTDAEMVTAFDAAELSAAVDPAGPTGRGLWIARAR